MNGVSSDTQRLIKSMMRSSKLSHSQQKILDKCLQNSGNAYLPSVEDLDRPNRYNRNSSRQQKVFAFTTVEGHRPSKKPLDKIQQEIEEIGKEMVFRPKPLKDMTEEKTKLQDFFENPDRYKSQDSVKQTQSCAASTVDLTEEPRELDEFAILLNEIEERKEWLNDMYRLGQGEQYRSKIASEIALRVSRLEKLHKEKCREEVRAKMMQKGKTKK